MYSHTSERGSYITARFIFPPSETDVTRRSYENLLHHLHEIGVRSLLWH